MTWLIVPYLVITALFFIVGGTTSMIADSRHEERFGARCALFCWAWPALLIIGFALQLLDLLDSADLPDFWRHR